METDISAQIALLLLISVRQNTSHNQRPDLPSPLSLRETTALGRVRKTRPKFPFCQNALHLAATDIGTLMEPESSLQTSQVQHSGTI
jgi:hypothetical protein